MTISAAESGGKPVEIGYLITAEALTEAQCTKRDFTPYTDPLKLNTDGRYAVYAKLTNAVGNVTYLSSNGIVLDTTLPEISGVEDGEVYCTTKNVQITDDNLASVTVNGSPKTVDGHSIIWVALFSDANSTYKIVATDKAGNRTEKTITVYHSTHVIHVTGVSLNERSITLDVGGNQTRAATVTPEEAANKKVCWSSDNEGVATVSEDGAVTAVAGGTAVITATTHDGFFTDSCTVTVNAHDATPTIITDSLPDGKVGEEYSQTLTADGTEPIVWSISGGALPDGLKLDENTGKISGTPTVAGTATFTVKATNSAGSDTKDLPITIDKAAPAEFTITVRTDSNGTASASPATAAAEMEITLAATPNTGYHCKEWQAISGGVTIKNGKFTMPDSDVEVKASFEKNTSVGSGGVITYSITVRSSKNGNVSASHRSVAKGTTVTLTVNLGKGYELDNLIVLDSKDQELKLTRKNSKYSFTIPIGKDTVKVSFKEEFPDLPNPFSNLTPSDFCYDAVMWAVGKNITGGIGRGLFGPNNDCTRGQIVTFLWRAMK